MLGWQKVSDFFEQRRCWNGRMLLQKQSIDTVWKTILLGFDSLLMAV